MTSSAAAFAHLPNLREGAHSPNRRPSRKLLLHSTNLHGSTNFKNLRWSRHSRFKKTSRTRGRLGPILHRGRCAGGRGRLHRDVQLPEPPSGFKPDQREMCIWAWTIWASFLGLGTLFGVGFKGNQEENNHRFGAACLPREEWAEPWPT